MLLSVAAFPRYPFINPGRRAAPGAGRRGVRGARIVINYYYIPSTAVLWYRETETKTVDAHRRIQRYRE